jgi:heme exporter protein C
MTMPEDAARLVRRGTVISAAALLGVAGVYVLAWGYTPIEARQGVAQKIFYLHVPSAWCALLAFSLVAIPGSTASPRPAPRWGSPSAR